MDILIGPIPSSRKMLFVVDWPKKKEYEYEYDLAYKIVNFMHILEMPLVFFYIGVMTS